MNKQELIGSVAEATGFTKGDAGRAVEAVFESVSGALKKGETALMAELFNDGWVRLTTGHAVGFVGFETDRSPVRAHKRGFNKIRLVVKDRDITLDYLDLVFADGSTQKIAGERKRVEPEVGFGPIDIKGGPKIIKEIEKRYRSRFFDKDAKGADKATVEIWAKR